MPDTPQANMISREDLRSELRAFAAESLQAELSNMAGRLQRGIHADLQEMLVDLQRALEHRSHTTSPRSLTPKRIRAYDLRSTATKDQMHNYPSAPEASMPTDVLPGAVAPETLRDSSEVEARKPLVISEGALVEMGKETHPASAGGTLTRSSSNDSLGEGKSRKSVSSNGSGELKRESNTSKNNLPRGASSRRSHLSSAKRKRDSGAQVDRFSWIMRPEESKSPIQRRLLYIVNHNVFDYVVAALIVLNGLVVGVQTDYMAREDLEDPPIAFQVVEIIFCVVFTVELTIRLIAFRCAFFLMSQRAWNIFDFVIVNLQLLEIFMSLVAAGVGFSFNILRILRLIRVVRLARALRLIGELRTIVSSIAGSVKPLFWTGVLLLLIAYVVGVALTQLVHTKRLLLIENGEHIPDALEIYWGHLIPAIFTLIMSITGGVDWDTVCRPLMEKIGVEVGVLFTFYILFSSLAMLNVVTGVFIDSVMVNKKEELENRTMDRVQTLFAQLDVDEAGELHWEEFESQLDRKEMKDFFKIIDVDSANAKSLFELLDLDDSGSVDACEFMDGCLRIWAPAKGLDLRMISRDIIKQGVKINKLQEILEALTRMNGGDVMSMNGVVVSSGFIQQPEQKMVTAG